MTEVGLKKTKLDTPFLWVELDLLESNITYLSEYFEAGGANWRPPMPVEPLPRPA